MHKKIAEMVPIIYFWWVPEVCWRQGQSVRSEVHRIIWYFLFQAAPAVIFMLQEIEYEIYEFFRKVLLPPMEYIRDEEKYNNQSLVSIFLRWKLEQDN